MATDPPKRELLYVEADPRVRAATARRFRRRHRHVSGAGSARETEALVDSERDWSVFIVDHVISGDNGLDLLRRVSRRWATALRMLTTPTLGSALEEICTRDGIRPLQKPVAARDLEPMLAAIASSPAPERRSREAVVRELCIEIGASPREAQVLVLVQIESLTYPEIATELGISTHTVRSHTRQVLAKAGSPSMRGLRRLLRARVRQRHRLGRIVGVIAAARQMRRLFVRECKVRSTGERGCGIYLRHADAPVKGGVDDRHG